MLARLLPLSPGMTTSSQTFDRPMPALVAQGAAPGLLASLRHRVAEIRCQLHGHAPQLRFDPERMFLCCPTCRVESPGWQLDQPAPRLRQPGASDRFARYRWLAASSGLQSRVESGEFVME